MQDAGRILSIQAGKVAPLRPQAGGEALAVRSAIAKAVISSLAAPQSVAVARLGLAGDEQADPAVHGGIEKAVYAYPAAHYAHWQRFLGRAQALPFGSLGENLTVEGLTEADLWLGDTLLIGACTFLVTQPRRPCHKLASWLGDARVGREMLQQGITGWYLAVETPGEIRAGDGITVLPGTRQVALAERVRQMTRRVDLD
ncbi:MAG TPA: MOSC domain-containing protein [Rhodocyclaceae bacterium]|nr:MOSC domain-containing protein [Rhodocyclaceae bacterium]